MLPIIKKIINKDFSNFYRSSRLYIVTDVVLIILVLFLTILLIRLYKFQPNLSLKPWVRHKKAQVVVIDLNNPPLSLSYESEASSIFLEEGAKINLHLKNTGNHLLSDIKLKLILDNSDFLLSRLEFSGNQKTNLSGLEIKGFNIYLNEIKPGAQREVSLDIFFTKTNSLAKIINSHIDFEYSVEGQILKESLPISEFKVASQLTGTAKAYYNSPQGDKLGSGSFPPISELPTNFWVFFEAMPSSNFSNLTITGRLAPNVEFTNKTSLLDGDLSYNKDARQVVWQLKELSPANTSSYRAGFEISLRANEDQVGSYAKLLNSLKLQALDNFSGLIIYQNLDDIDTSLKYDAINRDEGIITNIEKY